MLSNFITLIFYNVITKSVDELQEIANGKLQLRRIYGSDSYSKFPYLQEIAYINLLEALMPYPAIPVLPR